MTYHERLTPWIVVRLLPKMQRAVMGRFRRRVDAEGHLRFLQQQIPDGEFRIVFDCPSEDELPNSEYRILHPKFQVWKPRFGLLIQ